MTGMAKKGITYVKNSLGNIREFGLKISVYQILAKIIPRLLPIRFRYLVNPLVLRSEQLITDYLVDNYGDVIKRFGYTPDSRRNFNQPSKRVWIMWLQGEDQAPELVQACVKSVRRHNSDADIQIVTLKNIKKFIDVPKRLEMLFNAKKINAAHFSDYCRVALLAKYGGIWVDSTVYMTGSIPDEVFGQRFYTVRAIKPRKEIMSIARYRWNTFFMGTNGSSKNIFVFAQMFLEEYWTRESSSIDYLLIDYVMDIAYENFNSIKSDVDRVPINNSKILWLEQHTNEAFLDSQWNTIKSNNNYVYKMTYKNEHRVKKNSKETYFFKLLNGRL